MKNAASFDWSDAPVAYLQSRWAEGVAASVIADEICKLFNASVTRNAVLGKADRLGLKDHAGMNCGRPQKPRVSKPKTPTPQLQIKPASARPQTKPLKFVERRNDKPAVAVHLTKLENHHCKWVLGEPAALMYCGGKRSPGSPYCSTHTKLAFNRAH